MSNRAHVNENASMRAFAKILRARASEQPCNFCEQFEQRPNFASTLKSNGTIRYPSMSKPMVHLSVTNFHFVKPGLIKHVLLVWMELKT